MIGVQQVTWLDGSLEADEKVIEHGLASFVDVGAALQHIRDRRLYLEVGYESFDAYCKQRWGMDRSWGYRHIDGARVVEAVSPIGDTPQNLEQTKPLAKVLNEHGEKRVRDLWAEIVAKHEGDGPITGREIGKFVSTGGANYGKPSWHELLGQVGDTLLKAQKDFEKFDRAIGERPRADAIREKAARYAGWAEGLAERLRKVAA